jgi:hypothetical protein
MDTDFMSLTQLGRYYGVTSHIMGRWLIHVGLRTTNLRPSQVAFSDGYVKKRDCRNERDFWVWHMLKTMGRLKEAGYEPP